MRQEHKYHVAIIAAMMLIILAAFAFVVLGGNSKPTITTSLPSAGNLQGQEGAIVVQQASSYANEIEVDVLIGFLILLALLFIWYLSIKISKELRNKS